MRSAAAPHRPRGGVDPAPNGSPAPPRLTPPPSSGPLPEPSLATAARLARPDSKVLPSSRSSRVSPFSCRSRQAISTGDTLFPPQPQYSTQNFTAQILFL